jgi:O-antigen ligase
MPLHLFFFYATIILFPTQLGYHFWPDWALVLGRRLDYLSPTLFLTDISIFLTLVFWMLSSRKHMYRLKIGICDFLENCPPAGGLKIGIYIPLILAFLYVSCNIYFATSPIISFSKWLKVLEFVVFGFYIIKTKPSFSRSLWCFSFAVFYSSIIAIAQFFLQHSVGGFLWYLGERTFDVTTPGIARIQLLLPSVFRFQSSEYLRPYATFPHPNVLGGFLAVTLPLVIFNNVTTCLPARQVKQLNNWQASLLKTFRVITIIVGFLALLLTFSRSAWVAGIIGLIIVSVIYFKSIKNYSFLVFMAFVVFIGLFFVLPYFQTLTPESESVFVRNELNSAAISMINPYPYLSISLSPHLFFGVGLGNFLIELPKYYPHRDIFFLQPVHNIYLLLLSETGIVGFLFCVYFLWNLLKHKTRKRSIGICLPSIGSCRRQVQAGLLSFVILLLLGIVDHYPLTLQQGQLLLTILLSFSYLSYSSH